MRREETGSDPSVHWIRESCSLLNKDHITLPANPLLTSSKGTSFVYPGLDPAPKDKKTPHKKIKLRF
jgi:hypothetical protein